MIFVQVGQDHGTDVLGPQTGPGQLNLEPLLGLQQIFVLVEGGPKQRSRVVLAMGVGLLPVQAGVDHDRAVLGMINQERIHRDDDVVRTITQHVEHVPRAAAAAVELTERDPGVTEVQRVGLHDARSFAAGVRERRAALIQRRRSAPSMKSSVPGAAPSVRCNAST